MKTVGENLNIYASLILSFIFSLSTCFTIFSLSDSIMCFFFLTFFLLVPVAVLGDILSVKTTQQLQNRLACIFKVVLRNCIF